MYNPRLAIWLYFAVVMSSIMLTSKWRDFVKAVVEAKEAKMEVTANGQ